MLVVDCNNSRADKEEEKEGDFLKPQFYQFYSNEIQEEEEESGEEEEGVIFTVPC